MRACVRARGPARLAAPPTGSRGPGAGRKAEATAAGATCDVQEHRAQEACEAARITLDSVNAKHGHHRGSGGADEHARPRWPGACRLGSPAAGGRNLMAMLPFSSPGPLINPCRRDTRIGTPGSDSDIAPLATTCSRACQLWRGGRCWWNRASRPVMTARFACARCWMDASGPVAAIISTPSAWTSTSLPLGPLAAERAVRAPARPCGVTPRPLVSSRSQTVPRLFLSSLFCCNLRSPSSL